MQATILHVITGWGSGSAKRTLKRTVLAYRCLGASRQVVVSLTDAVTPGGANLDADIEIHNLGLRKLSHFLGALFRLIFLIRNVKPDVVMTWRYQANFMGTLAAIASGVGANQVVWNLTSANVPNRKWSTRCLMTLLAWLSPLPRAIVSRSRSDRRIHEALGYRGRRWFRLPPGAKKTESYRQLWRFVCGIHPRRVRRRRHRPRRLQRTFLRLRNWRAQLRRLWLFKTTFIAVTGSCGKTTATKLAAAILATEGPCYRRGPGNIFQSSLKALLSVPALSKYCIQEVSAFPLGAITRHSRLLRPHIAIVTTIGSDHYKAFRGLEATAVEKGQLVENLPRHGIAILNADDPFVRAMANRTRAKVITFGLSPDADVRAIEVSSQWPDRLSLTVIHGQESASVRTRLVGEHWTTSVLAAIACGVACGVQLQICAKVLGKIKPAFGRYSIHSKPGGPIYVLDSRKAPFWTIASGINFMAQAQSSRKTIVVGTISDCPGSGSPKYRKVAREALQVADRVIFVGPNASFVSKLVRQEELQRHLFIFQTSYQASRFLNEQVLPDELIYIKASITDHLERVMLSQRRGVVCWRERCGRKIDCHKCRAYRKPHAPPFGFTEATHDRAVWGHGGGSSNSAGG
jgi:UDP-N-acetylmuramoyl-tripeptide--D-alanyl-D-alanine ligase